MLNLNRAMIIGNATRDPELRTTPNGKSVASFAVATNRRYQDSSGERREEVQFHEIVAWGKLGEIAEQIIKKGSRVYVDGRIQTRSWEGQDGNKRERTEIIAENIIGLSSRAESENFESSSGPTETSAPTRDAQESDAGGEKPATNPPAGKEKSQEDEINLDDIPF